MRSLGASYDARRLTEAVPTRRGRGGRVIFDPTRHPRNALGQFRDVLNALPYGSRVSVSRRTAELPDGTRVTREPNGTYRVTRAGRIVAGFQRADLAARDALDRSARATNSPEAVGGQRRYQGFSDFVWARTGERPEPIYTADELTRVAAELPGQASAAARGTEYERRQEPTIRAKQTDVRLRGVRGEYAESPGEVVSGSDPARPPAVDTPRPTHMMSPEALEAVQAAAADVGYPFQRTGVVHDDDGPILYVTTDNAGSPRVYSARLSVLEDPEQVDVWQVDHSGTQYSAPGFERAYRTARGWPVTYISPTQPMGEEAHPRPESMRGATTTRGRTPDPPPPPVAPRRPGAYDVGAPPTVANYGGGSEAQRARVAKVQGIVNTLHGFSQRDRDNPNKVYTAKIRVATDSEFHGSVLDETGQAIGSFSRSVRGEGIYHSSYSMEDRGSGFGAAFIERSFQAYKDAGFKRVTVHAASTTGGYMWAKMGFQFHQGSTAANTVSRYTADQFVRAGKVPEALVEELFRQIDEGDIKTPQQLAAFGRRTTWTETAGYGDRQRTHTVWLGKAMLLGQSWYGIKELRD